MGRTVRTFRDAVEREEQRWRNFRRALPPSERDILDGLFDSAREHADAATMVVAPRPIEVVLISALIDLIETVTDLKDRIRRLEEGARHGV